jgi:hypothetical protein
MAGEAGCGVSSKFIERPGSSNSPRPAGSSNTKRAAR